MVLHPLLWALMGGMLIGLSAFVLLVFNGRIAGISGILEGLFDATSERSWRLAFLAGLLVGGGALFFLRPDLFGQAEGRSTLTIVVAGLLVGFGTRLGSGCTSGHGICGLPRFSRRSLVAVVTFMATGMATVYVVQHLLGGA